MRIVKTYISFALALMAFFAISGCTSLETDFGTLAGAVFFNDNETRVAGAWVRIYESVEPPVLLAEIPVDDEARFFITLKEGTYYLYACPERYGDYTGLQDPVSIFSSSTTRIYISVKQPAPQMY